MDWLKNNKIAGVTIILVFLDLIIKLLLSGYNIGHITELLGFITIHKTKTMMSFSGMGLQVDNVLKILIKVILELFFIVITVRIYKRNIKGFLQLSFSLITGGIIGGFLDKLIFMKGNWNYVSTEYLHIIPFQGIASISSLMIDVGFIMSLVAIIVKFKSFKTLFGKKPQS